MIQFLFEQNIIIYAFAGLCGLGLLVRLIVNQVFKNLVKASENPAEAKNKLVKLIKMRFEACYKAKIGVNNVDTFVDKNVLKYRFCGILLSTWDNFGGQILFLNLLTVPVSVVFGVTFRCGQDKILLTGSVGILSSAILILVDKSINLSAKRRMLHLNLLDYLDNFCKIRLEQETFYPELYEQMRREYAQVAEAKKQVGTSAERAESKKERAEHKREAKQKKEEEKKLQAQRKEEERRRLEEARREEERRRQEERRQAAAKRREEELRKIEEERKALEARQAELKKLSMESQEDNQAEDAMEKPAEKPGKRYAGKSSGKGAEAVTEKKQSGKVSGVEEPVISSMERERSMEVSAEKETSVPKELFADNSAEFPAEDLREELETRENILHSMEHDLKPSQERMDLNKVLQGLDEIAASKERDQQEKKLLEKAEKKAATAAKGSGKGRSLQNSQEDKVIEEVLKEFFA